MHVTARLAGVGGLALAASALFAGPASAHAAHHRDPHSGGAHSGAVFVQTDGVGGNAVVAYDRAADGTLHLAGTYATNGLGGVLAGSVVDHLASQGSLVYDREHRLLYAVNAGSDTITVFRVDGAALERVQVIGSGGSFPVSIAFHDNAVYVLNARGGGSVQGFRRDGDRLVRVADWHRDLGLDPAATPEFTHTPGQVTFAPDGRRLLVTTKANTNAVDVFGVDGSGRLASAPPVVDPLPGAVPFAAAFDRHGHLALAQAGTNSVDTYTLRADGTLKRLSSAPTGQAATCWVVANGDAVYASNAGSASLSGYRIAADGTTTALGRTPTDAGTVDASVTGNSRFLYVQGGAAGVVDAFAIEPDGSLTALGAVTVAGAVGAEGIASS
jgi:6-phosphogluconolactonase (cycloisomerase 2 family)